MALIDKASLLMVPSTYEAGKLYNVLPSGNRAPDSTDQNSGYDQTRADFDFDRGSNASATRIGSDGLIKKYRENLILQSNNFGVGPWANAGTTDTSGQEGYDGTNNAWLITKVSANGRMEQSVSSTGVSTLSVYAKANDSDWVLIQHIGGSNPYAFFNISTGEKGAIGGAIDSKIESVGNGWYRLSIVSSVAITQVRIYPAEVNTTSATSGSIFIQSAQLESGLVASSYLESTSVTGKAGVLVDLPRINYDANGENGALLLEPSRTNLLEQGEYYNAYYTRDGVSVTDNALTSPEGLQNASKLVEDSANSKHRIGKATFPSGTQRTLSVFAKAGERNYISLFENNAVGSDVKGAIFNLSNGTLSINNSPTYYSNPTIEPIGSSGWYRCSVTWTATSLSVPSFGVSADGLENTYQGDGTSGIYIYGAQLEAGSYVSSYIPTMGTSETRAADSCLGATDASLFNDSSMSLFLDLPATNQETAIKEITISDGTSNNRFNIYSVTSNQLRTSLVSGGSVILNYVVSDIITNQHLKILITYTGSTYKVFVNGALELNVTMSTPPVGLNNINFANATDSSLFYGQVKQAAVFTEALSDAECITLTTL